MIKWLQKNKQEAFLILKLILLWRLLLFVFEVISTFLIPRISEFLGPVPWANFDGVHYLNIAQFNYGVYEYSFFPLYPLAIRFFASILLGNYLLSSLAISYLALFIGLFLFYKLVKIDNSSNISKRSVLWLLFFPTSFYFVSSYTESFFIMFMFGSFYFARKGKFLAAALFVALASATKTIGIFILPALLIEFYLYSRNKKLNLKEKIYNLFCILAISPVGLLSYMYYLYFVYHDSLLFIHNQPNFGAGRTGGDIVLLPQVIFRYMKIFLTVPVLTHDFLIALVEFLMFGVVLVMILWNFKKIRLSYLVFSLLAIIGPTLTGTLSSEPRYTLVAFPLFIMLASQLNQKLRLILLPLSVLLLAVLTMYFLRGYFIA